MDTTRISIARVLAMGVAVTWQEAVAVAHEAAVRSDVDSAMNGQPSLVHCDACFITGEGDVELPETTGEASPDAVAALLRAMLGGRDDVPAGLKALLAARGTHDMYQELQRFPVLNRRAVIGALATRALARHGQTVTTPPPASPPTSRPAPPAALAPPVVPLRQATVASTPTPVPPPVPPAAVAMPAVVPYAAAATSAARPTERDGSLALHPGVTEFQRLRLKTAKASASPARSSRASDQARRLWLAGAALVASALLILVWSIGRAPALERAPEVLVAHGPSKALPLWPFAAAVVPNTPARGAGRVWPDTPYALSALSAPPDGMTIVSADQGRSFVTAPTASGDAPASGTTAVEIADLEVDRAREPREPFAAARVTVPVPVTAAPRPLDTAPSRSMAAAVAGTAAAAAARGVPFTADDADVAPPTLRRPQLPLAPIEPGAPVPEGWPYLLLVVDESGAVESVRLNARPPAPGQTLYRHSMLMAAAKAWQFEPARKNGQAVRYEVRVPLEP